MLALIIAVLFSVPGDPSVLTVPHIQAKIEVTEIEKKKERWMRRLHMCENPNNVPSIIDSNGLRSTGKYMWQERSWLNYTKQGATKENISDPVMQDKITRYVLDHGGWRNWLNCGRIIEKRIGQYPLDK